jgi:hypothetical protein
VNEIELTREIERLKERLAQVEIQGSPVWVYLAAPLTSTSWNGDAKSTTAKTLLDLSSVFSAPAGVRAVLVKAWIKDSGSAANECLIRFAPNNTAGQGLEVRCSGVANDRYSAGCVVVPCDVNGDIYYQIAASGSGTLDANIEIWGYQL